MRVKVPINVAVDVGVKLGQFEDELLHGFAYGVQVADDDGSVRHAAYSHRLGEVPDGNARRLEVLDVRDGRLREVD